MISTVAAPLGERTRRLLSSVRILCVRATGASIGAGCCIGPGCDLSLGSSSPRRGRLELGSGCELGAGVILHPYNGSIRLARNVFVGPRCVIYGHGGVEIGDACLIAAHCSIVSSNHAIPPLGTDVRSQPDVLRPTKIGRDVWLGAGVIVLGGVTIGDGCIVGAGSVVTKSLPAGAIAHGTPAEVKGWRDHPSRLPN